jgi:hypothetical protein
MNEIPPITDPLGRKCVFSDCRRYRYTLWREWDEPEMGLLGLVASGRLKPGSYLMVIGLNPSTADETNDDPTVRRCINFAKHWGFGALCMTNLFAYRATDPEVMKKTMAPVGETIDSNTSVNCKHLVKCAAGAGMVLAAWGKHGSHLNRAAQVIRMLPPMHTLGINKDGSPKHPLYVAASATPILLPST